MANNPLQKFFRQPKIFVKLPSQGAYNAPNTLQGDVNSVPVYGMTGMDEIIMKTPDALLSGESAVKVIESCCPNITNAWELSVLDTGLIFAAIRIATYGNMLTVEHTCPHCKTENEYDLDVTRVVEYFTSCKYDNKIVLKDLVIKTQPLTYAQSTKFAFKNFTFQQKLSQIDRLEDEAVKQANINKLFAELSEVQNELYLLSIESVEADGQVVTEREYIREWLVNCDKHIFEAIKTQIDKNRNVWTTPPFPVKCPECETETNVTVDLDQSNFFA